MNNQRSQSNTEGFALILALIVSSVALAIGLSLLDITVKQLSLSTTVRESEIAFQAAAAGINCIQTARNRYVYETQDNSLSTFQMECLEQQITMTDLNTNVRKKEFETEVDWITPSGIKLCIQMELMVLNGAEPIPVTAVSETASNGETFNCSAGDICTFAFARGYNRSCDDVVSGVLFSVQRELTAEF